MFEELAAVAMEQWHRSMAQIRRQSGDVTEPPTGSGEVGERQERPILKVTNYIWVFGDDARVAAGGTVWQEVRAAAATAELARNLEWVLRYLDRIELTDEDAAKIHTQVQGLLAELARPNPNRDEIAPRLRIVKKVLTPVAAGLATAVSAETAGLAADILERLTPWFAS